MNSILCSNKIFVLYDISAVIDGNISDSEYQSAMDELDRRWTRRMDVRDSDFRLQRQDSKNLGMSLTIV